eukprot:1619440-Pyramimonas_sp.AAC.1
MGRGRIIMWISVRWTSQSRGHMRMHVPHWRTSCSCCSARTLVQEHVHRTVDIPAILPRLHRMQR